MPSPTATIDFGVPLDNTMGAMYIGVIVSGVLHGFCLMQAVFYFTSYQKDTWIIKGMVITTCMFDAIHLFLISHAMYHYLVFNFGNEEALHRLVWTVVVEALMTGLNAAIVQTFYTYRVWTLSKKNYLLCGTILFFVAATAACGITWVALAMRSQTYLRLLKISPLAITIHALSCTVDVTIAASLSWMLHRSRTGFRRSDTIINKLMVFVVNTGLLTATCAVGSLICLIVSPETLIYASFYFCIGRFYTNSFLATLNARKRISTSDANTTQDHSSLIMSMSRTVKTGQRPVQDISIRIETTKQAIDDRGEMQKTPMGVQVNESILSDATSRLSMEKV